MLWLEQFRYLAHKKDRSGGIFFDQQNKRAVSHEKDKTDKEWPALSTKRCTSFSGNTYIFFYYLFGEDLLFSIRKPISWIPGKAS